MGCLNSTKSFKHWFANIHFSGRCNRNCYFCIGQFMQALEPFNNLSKEHLDGFEEFLDKCKSRSITEVALTGSNTDPLLYKFIPQLKDKLQKSLDLQMFRVTTNGVRVLNNLDTWKLFDFASITFCSFDKQVNQEMMGGEPVNIQKIIEHTPFDFRINVLLSTKNVCNNDLMLTIDKLIAAGTKKINLREPYGQPNMRQALITFLQQNSLKFSHKIFGNDALIYKGCEICYWDVHFTEVESVNLYANGRVSDDYPITRGHDAETGTVVSQDNWEFEGRKHQQWLY